MLKEAIHWKKKKKNPLHDSFFMKFSDQASQGRKWTSGCWGWEDCGEVLSDYKWTQRFFSGGWGKSFKIVAMVV